MTGPGGGIVFFIDYMDQYPSFCAEADCNYLEASPADASVEATTTFAWCSDTTGLLGLDGWDKSAVGAGRVNTAFMLEEVVEVGGIDLEARCTSGAAVAANDYSNTHNGDTYSDWWLPSIGELMVMYTNLRTAGVGGFATEFYWSSSEGAATNAWRQNFDNGLQNVSPKTGNLRVRPVRAF